MLVYKTNLCFHLYTHADAQVGQVPSSGNEEATYVAAHSGTLPTLRLHQLEFSDASVSVAQNTTFFYGWNTTIFLPEIANQIDSLIDESTPNSNLSLRTEATDILNKVSSGKLSPKEGLRQFLAALNQVIRLLDRSNTQKVIILDAYAFVAENYWNKVNNGYPLLQQLCQKSTGEVVDDLFYMGIQAQMHIQVQSELQELYPQDVIVPPLPNYIDIRPLLVLFAGKAPNLQSPMAQEYIKLCILATSVQAAAIQFFIYLHPLTPEQRSDDLDHILNIKTSATIQKTNLSHAASSLYKAALKVIRSRTQEPANMDFILLSVLVAISRGLIPLQIQSQIKISTEAKKQLSRQIQVKIPATILQQKGTAEKYFKLCAGAETVRQVAESFFIELLYLPDSLKATEIHKLSLIQKAKIGSVGLSPNALKFHGEVLKTIKTKHKVENPRNVPGILVRLLLHFNPS